MFKASDLGELIGKLGEFFGGDVEARRGRA
jgi:hypothetical protein